LLGGIDGGRVASSAASAAALRRVAPTFVRVLVDSWA
jgi:hypothetical protein